MNTTAFRHSPRECDRGGLGKKHTAAKAKSTEKGVESREGTDAATHREGARADLTAAKGKPCLAQAPPAPALGSSPSRPVPRRPTGYSSSDERTAFSAHLTRSSTSTPPQAGGPPRPGGQLPGKRLTPPSSLLLPFSDPPTPGRRRQRSRPTSEC